MKTFLLNAPIDSKIIEEEESSESLTIFVEKKPTIESNIRENENASLISRETDQVEKVDKIAEEEIEEKSKKSSSS